MQSAPDETAIAEAVTAGTDGIVVPPALLEDPPAPWRLCSDAPEVASCGCFGGSGECP